MSGAPIEGDALKRQVYIVLSPRALAYAQCALQSLWVNSIECLNLHLITDSVADRETLAQTMNALPAEDRHSWSVSAEEELNDAEARVFAGLAHLRGFRHGHPCWRKITDPHLLSATGDEMVLLDPDLYFPNRFRFEATPAKGLCLMWQHPNCLLPPEVVTAAFEADIPLARHVDIGVAHWRANGDLEWLNWVIGRLGGSSLPHRMHVEAIVWAAIAMREGGGYLDPQRWVCWRRSQMKRIRLKLGATGASIFSSEPWSQIKCFHAGGEAKWWLPTFGAMHTRQSAEEAPTSAPIAPFIELTRQRYDHEQLAKGVLRGLGYYRIFGARA